MKANIFVYKGRFITSFLLIFMCHYLMNLINTVRPYMRMYEAVSSGRISDIESMRWKSDRHYIETLSDPLYLVLLKSINFEMKCKQLNV